jgi:hypothetical protein
MAETRVPNRITEEGQELGRHMARLCDRELAGKPDDRCRTCAFRAGDHLANGSPETLMTAVKCLMERIPFWCHEGDHPCAGWMALRVAKGDEVTVPWECVPGSDYKAGDVILLPDESGRDLF